MVSVLEPGIWIPNGDSRDSGVMMSVDEIGTALIPFSNANTTFWASKETTDKVKLGYSYPGLNELEAAKMAIENIVYHLSTFGSFVITSSPPTSSFGTGPSSAAAPVEKEREDPPQGKAANPGRADVPRVQSPQVSSGHDHGSRPTVHPNQHVPPNQVLWEWTVRVEFNKYELGMSFSVPIFLGTVPEDPEEWLVSPNFVGAHHAYVNSIAVLRANRQDQGNVVEEGFVHLNKAITQHSGLASLEPAVIEPYLTQQLNWRVQKADGSVAELQSLEVSVVATPLSYPPGSQFPVPGKSHRYNRITYGRHGGSRLP